MTGERRKLYVESLHRPMREARVVQKSLVGQRDGYRSFGRPRHGSEWYFNP